jgi:outer membrane protein OmpA-like peptidoglycan-associated protein
VFDRLLAGIGETGTFFLLVLVAGACATNSQVREEVGRLGETEQRLAGLQSRLDSLTEEIESKEAALAARGEELAAARAQAALALEQARRAQAAASGNLSGETVFRLDGVGFEPGTSRLTEGSRLLLDQLVDRLRAENAAYFLEVQSDPEEAGSALGAARVDAVRRYLHEDRGLPLHSVGAVTGTRQATHPPGVSADAEASAVDPLVMPTGGDGQLAILVVRDQPQP